MKPFRNLCILSVSLLLAIACENSEERSIRHNAQGYLDAMGAYEIDSAYSYATKETQEITLPVAKKLTAITDSNYIRRNTPATTEILSIKQINDSVAVVKFHKKTPIASFDGQLEMHKENGQWLAHVVLAQMDQPSDSISDTTNR